MAPRTPEIDESTAKTCGWSRSDAHVAGEDVPELGQLVDGEEAAIRVPTGVMRGSFFILNTGPRLRFRVAVNLPR